MGLSAWLCHLLLKFKRKKIADTYTSVTPHKCVHLSSSSSSSSSALLFYMRSRKEKKQKKTKNEIHSFCTMTKVLATCPASKHVVDSAAVDVLQS